MNTLSLRIEQQYAKLGMQSQNAALEIEQPKADMNIQQKAPTMEIDQGPGTLEINGEEFRASLGYKSSLRMTRDIANQTYHITSETIGRIAEEGSRLAEIEKGISVADLAVQRMEQGPMPIDDAGPPAPIEMSYTPHPTRIDWILGGTKIETTPQYPVTKYIPGNLQIYLAQKNDLKIDVVGRHMDMQY